jgi:hypothetical protein
VHTSAPGDNHPIWKFVIFTMGVSLVAEFVTEVLAECRTVPYAAPQVGIVWAGPGEPLGSSWGASGEPRELLEHLGGLVVSRTLAEHQ